jgi:hypothetical protein
MRATLKIIFVLLAPFGRPCARAAADEAAVPTSCAAVLPKSLVISSDGIVARDRRLLPAPLYEPNGTEIKVVSSGWLGLAQYVTHIKVDSQGRARRLLSDDVDIEFGYSASGRCYVANKRIYHTDYATYSGFYFAGNSEMCRRLADLARDAGATTNVEPIKGQIQAILARFIPPGERDIPWWSLNEGEADLMKDDPLEKAEAWAISCKDIPGIAEAMKDNLIWDGLAWDGGLAWRAR